MYSTFDDLLQAAKDAGSTLCVLCGVQYNVKGKLLNFTDKLIVLKLEDSTEILLDRSKLLGAFIAPAEQATESDDAS